MQIGLGSGFGLWRIDCRAFMILRTPKVAKRESSLSSCMDMFFLLFHAILIDYEALYASREILKSLMFAETSQLMPIRKLAFRHFGGTRNHGSSMITIPKSEHNIPPHEHDGLVLLRGCKGSIQCDPCRIFTKLEDITHFHRLLMITI